MKIYTDDSLNHFEFWSGGADRADVLTSEQMDQVENELEQLYPDGIEDGQLNDLFWFESDTIANWLGFDSFEQLEKFNTEGEKYVIRFDDDSEDAVEVSQEFDSQDDAEQYVDNELEADSEYKEYTENLEAGDSVDIWICSNIHNDDTYCYKTLYIEGDGE